MALYMLKCYRKGGDVLTKLKKVFSLLFKAATKRKALTISLCSISVLVLALGIYVSQNLIYEVYIDGESIGYVRSYDEYETALDSIKETDGDHVGEKISARLTVALSEIKEDSSHLQDIRSTALTYANYKVDSTDENDCTYYSIGQAVASELVSSKSIDEAVNEAPFLKKTAEEASGYETEDSEKNITEESAVTEENNNDEKSEEKLYICSATIENLAREMLDLKQPATAILLGGTQVTAVASSESVNSIIDKVKEHYTPTSEDYSILSVTIPEEITTAEVYEAEENILSTEDAVEAIINGTPAPISYTIQQGDTIWDIAMTNSITTDAIQSANPDMNMDKIQINDEITLPLTEPYVHVEVEAKVTSQSPIPYSTKEVSDKTLLKGNTKVTQAGENGIEETVTKVTLINGMTTSQEVLSTATVKAAVDKIVAVGTKVVTTSKPSTSTSSSSSSASSSSSKGFIRPANGVLTSNYGYRSSGFHTGIDLAASTGTKVVASKAGTVTFSGWNGGYGYCVIISHGGGVTTLYAHNSSNKVSVGDYVKQGETIALMGSTGNSTGPHCHFEVRINNVHQNPWNYIN